MGSKEFAGGFLVYFPRRGSEGEDPLSQSGAPGTWHRPQEGESDPQEPMSKK